jgi:hypothetical protein
MGTPLSFYHPLQYPLVCEVVVDWGAAWTDGLLAVVACTVGARCVFHGGGAARTGGLGLLLIGIAAAFGAVRFSVAPGLTPVHMGLAKVAGAAGVPLVAVGLATATFARAYARSVGMTALVLLPVAAVVLMAIEPYRVGIAGLGVLVAAGSGALLYRRDRAPGTMVALGALVVLVAGLGIAGEGIWAGLSRVGWFHLAMAAACLLLGLGLQRADPAPSSDPPQALPE